MRKYTFSILNLTAIIGLLLALQSQPLLTYLQKNQLAQKNSALLGVPPVR